MTAVISRERPNATWSGDHPKATRSGDHPKATSSQQRTKAMWSEQRTKATWLTGAAGLLIVAAAFVMMVVAAPAQPHPRAAITQTTTLAATQLATDPTMAREQSLTQWTKPNTRPDAHHQHRQP
jgi:hypothetical protein